MSSLIPAKTQHTHRDRIQQMAFQYDSMFMCSQEKEEKGAPI